MSPIVFSGIQPSGVLTIGNYFGALKNFVTLQNTHQCYFCIVDLHALTVPQDPDKLRSQIRDTAALFIAAGIDPTKSTIFVQSQVSAHSELSWLLECNSLMGELSRMTQFKDKSIKQQSIRTGLLTYPILMAADILLYDTNLVPVGADQKQHLELTRDVAIRFNNRYGDIFTIPEVYIPEVGAKIMSLSEPTQKMSKSDDNLSSFVGLLDDEKTIMKKFSKAVTDSDGEIRFDPEQKPGVSNLLSILSVATDQKIDALVESLAGEGYGTLKKKTGEAVCNVLLPLQERFHEVRNSSELDDILREGAKTAHSHAAKTLRRTQQALGLL